MTATAARTPKARGRRQRVIKPKMTEHEMVVHRLRNRTDQELVDRWHDMLTIIRVELKNLDRQRQTMDAVTFGVFNKNKRLLEHPGRRFYGYIFHWYGAAMALGYRRQTDPKADSASLRVLLDELRARPHAYRLEFIRRHVGPAAQDDVIRAEVMAPVLGADGSLDLTIIDADIATLTGAGKKVKKFVNKSVAHTDRRTWREGGADVTFREITEANEACESIAERWLKALGGYPYPIRHEETFEWLDIFDFPWRFQRPRDDEGTRRYIVTVDRLLDDAEAAEMFASEAARNEYRRQRVLEITDLAAALELNGSTGGETCIPVNVDVERIL